MSHFEVVQTDAAQPWHIRLVASNGKTILTSENYTRRRSAESAVAVAAEVFGVAMNRPPDCEGDLLVGIQRLTGLRVSCDVRYVDERRPAPEPKVAQGPYWVSNHREGFWHDGDYHWRFCYGDDDCTQSTPPAGAEIAVRGGRTTLRADS